jgi:hypothetical protein
MELYSIFAFGYKNVAPMGLRTGINPQKKSPVYGGFLLFNIMLV